VITNHPPEHVALVAALRSQFKPEQLDGLKRTLDDHRGSTGAAHALYLAVADAADLTYDAGERVHPAVRAFLDRAPMKASA
jgi:hypothetical protein